MCGEPQNWNSAGMAWYLFFARGLSMAIFVKKNQLQDGTSSVVQQELDCYLIPNFFMILQFLFLM